MKFYLGIHNVADAWRFERTMISINRLKSRKSDFKINRWLLDSGAFTTLLNYGRYHDSPEIYADQINRWCRCGSLDAAITQDWMCEEFILKKTELTIAEHQRLTIERYDALSKLTNKTQIMPVLQGYRMEEYIDHIEQYGDRLKPGMWVGVGSICKRNSRPSEIEAILLAIKHRRPDLRLHGFGIKLTALGSGLVQQLLHSADSMAWSYNARRKGRNSESHEEARAFLNKIESRPVQLNLLACPFTVRTTYT